MDDSSAGDVGVATALGRICALEAKLRQAIQHTHLLSSSFESDPAAADREREALLAIRCTMSQSSTALTVLYRSIMRNVRPCFAESSLSC